jgi:type IV pilus assembly protein PilO
MKFEEFNNLDPQNLGNWPIPVKAVIIALACAAVLGAGYYFDTQHQLVALTDITNKEEELKKEFKDKQWQAAALPKLKEQLAQIETTLAELLKKLPNKEQVDELIRDISQTVLASGLKSELFEPQYDKQTTEKGLYEKLPIKLQMSGDYHSFGKFVSGIAAMPRIVTQHDISITPQMKGMEKKGDKNKQLLTMEMTAQVYRYIEAEPDKPAEGTAGGTAGGTADKPAEGTAKKDETTK